MPVLKHRILCCAFACNPGANSALGSGEDYLGWSLALQISRFHEAWVLTSRENQGRIEAVLEDGRPPNLHFHYVAFPGWLRDFFQKFWSHGGSQLCSYLWQAWAYFEARNLHRRIGFDAFHHVTYANDWMASFIGALLPVPYLRGPGGGAHRVPKAFRREFPLRGRLAEHIRAIGQWFFRHDPFFILGQRRARAILVCNREAFDALPRKWQMKARLFPVNGVTTADLGLAASEREPPSGRFSVLSAGKLYRIKGFDLAIKAFGQFADAHPGAELMIVGDGPESAHLKELVRHLGIEAQVRFEGWLPRERLLAKLPSCDVFLFASLRDGGGAVVVDAMAAGKPVVCFDLAGPGLQVTDDCGIRVPAHSPEQAVKDMAAALERLYRDEGLRARMGRTARVRAESAYHWDRLGERILEVYNDVLGNQVGKG